MEIALVLAIVAAAVFAADFAKGLPSWSLTALGLAILATSFAVFLFEGFVK